MYSVRAEFLLGILAALITVVISLVIAKVMDLSILGSMDRGVISLITCGVIGLPLIPLGIFLPAFIEIDLWKLALMIGLFSWPLVVAMLRAARGRSTLRTLTAASLYIMSFAILVESGLSFFGLLNVQMSWGMMVEMANISGYLIGENVPRYWWIFFPAALCIWTLCFALYLTGWEIRRSVS